MVRYDEVIRTGVRDSGGQLQDSQECSVCYVSRSPWFCMYWTHNYLGWAIFQPSCLQSHPHLIFVRPYFLRMWIFRRLGNLNLVWYNASNHMLLFYLEHDIEANMRADRNIHKRESSPSLFLWPATCPDPSCCLVPHLNLWVCRKRDPPVFPNNPPLPKPHRHLKTFQFISCISGRLGLTLLFS